MGSEVNLEFLLEKFSKLIEKYHFVLAPQKSKYEAILANENVQIKMYTYSRENGISIVVVNLKDDKVYYLHNITEKKGINSREEIAKLKSAGLLNYNDEFKRIIARVAFMLENYCDDILSGDFSVMAEG